ncbi:MAG: MobF family relaxase [Leucobacter sp.]
MKGGVTLFRGTGTAARRYLEADRATADDYYLEAGTALAEFTLTSPDGETIDAQTLDADAYAAWVEWIDPVTGTSMGTPREAGGGKRGSPRFAEMVINAPKSLSIAAALHPEISAALDAAQADAANEIRQWLAQNSTTRVGPRGAQEVVPVESLQTVAVTHRTSRAGDPHRHIHFQIGTRVQAAGKWRALDTGALFKQQGAIRALGTAVIAAHPGLATVLDQHGLTLDSVTGEVSELQPFNAVMSKRARQVERNLDRLETEWEQTHPGESAGPVVQARLLHKAWAYERPGKKPSVLATEAGWRAELTDNGYNPDRLLKAAHRPVVRLDDLSIQEVASRALDRCAAGSSAWTPHQVREHVTRITTEHGVHAEPVELREFVHLATRLAVSDCFSILPEHAARPDHVAHLTSIRVAEAETRLRDLLTAATAELGVQPPDVAALPSAQQLDAGQLQAAAAIASSDSLVIVEGAAGSGKTTMLHPAIDAATAAGRKTRVVAPTKKAAHVAGEELGIPADSAAALVYAHGWRWNSDGVWTCLSPGDIDPDSGRRYNGPPENARLTVGERVVVDEAGMLDQDTAIALLTITAEAGATVALVGDRAQLPAVGHGGVLDVAAQIRGVTFDMTGLHRFTDAVYADLTLQLRDGSHPAAVFDRLQEMGLVHLYESEDAVHEHIALSSAPGDAITVATNEEAQELNSRIQALRLEQGELNHARTVTGSDGLDIGAGDVIQTRKNDSEIGVANRQVFTVQHVAEDGTTYAIENGDDRKRRHTVKLPAEYVGEHAHLAYASTAYGVQGTTTDVSHTVLGDGLDGAGTYVGMTRGRAHNTLHLIAANVDDAREQFVQAVGRDRADRGLEAATLDAQTAIQGIITNGPVAVVTAERERLTAAIKRAEQESGKWERAVAMLGQQAYEHEAEREEHDALVAEAEARLVDVRDEVLPLLFTQAQHDGAAYLASAAEAEHAAGAHRTAGRFKKRSTAKISDAAATTRQNSQRHVRERWGSEPRTPQHLEQWVWEVAQQHADRTPQVIDASEAAVQAQAARAASAGSQLQDRTRLTDGIFQHYLPGQAHRGSVKRHRDRWQARATELRDHLAEIEALPPQQAAELIQQRQAEAEAVARAQAERQKQLRALNTQPAPHVDRAPGRGIGD